VTEANADVEATLRAEGFEVATVEDAAGNATLEVVLSEAQAEKFAAAEGIDLEAKTNADGLTTAEAATLEAANGFEVWRTWAGPGGLREEMEDLEGEYDDLTQLITIGQSLLGEPIYAMRVTADADRVRRGKRPSVLYNAAQHAREWITPEVNRRLLRHVLEGYGTDDRITDILDTTELWFVLVANPDGYDHSFTEDNRLWRKNLRDNNGDGEITPGEGVDLNRNFATNWGYDNEGSSPVTTSDVYRGTGPNSEPETQALDRIMKSIDFSFLVNYHSAAELILYGVGWQVDDPTPDDLVNIALAGDDAKVVEPCGLTRLTTSPRNSSQYMRMLAPRRVESRSTTVS
jgi:murein tripeptide amidase MpaA